MTKPCSHGSALWGLLKTLVILVTVSQLGKAVTNFELYFEQFDDDVTGVKWAHATNSREMLIDALNDDEVIMIEADVMIGTKHGSAKQIPIMAHPPAMTSNLSMQDFLQIVIDENSNRSKIDRVGVGIKLDFKQIRAAELGLAILEPLDKAGNLSFPVWVNADVLQGPVNSTKLPVNADLFLELVHKHLPSATLSLGWVTRYGRDDIKADPLDYKQRTITNGVYSKENVVDMLDMIDKFDKSLKSHTSWENPITFPVRAGMAARSEETILHLINYITDHDTSITLWSADDDPVDLIKLRRLVSLIGKSRTFVDLPFSLWTGPGPKVIPDIKLEEVRNSSSSLLMSTLCLLFAALFNLLTKVLVL